MDLEPRFRVRRLAPRVPCRPGFVAIRLVSAFGEGGLQSELVERPGGLVADMVFRPVALPRHCTLTSRGRFVSTGLARALRSLPVAAAHSVMTRRAASATGPGM